MQYRTTGKTAIATVAVAVVLAACGGDGSESSSPSTSAGRETTTTTAPPPVPRTPAEQAFLAGLEAIGVDLGAGGDEREMADAVIGAAVSVCGQLDSAAEMESQAADLEGQVAGLRDDPGAAHLVEEGTRLANESRSIRDTHLRLAQMEAGVLYDQLGNEAGDAVISLMTQHLCPEHAGFTYQPDE